MKTKSISAITAILYSFLLYQQGAGINVLLLNIMLLGVLYFLHKEKSKNTYTYLFAIGAIVSAIFVAVHGHSLAIITNIVSLIFLSVNLHLQNASVASLLVQGIYAYTTSPIHKLLLLFQKKEESSEGETEKPMGINKTAIVLISSLVFILFISFYRHMSAGFNEFILNLNFDFISIPVLFHYAIGAVLLGTFFRPYILQQLEAREGNKKIHLNYKTFTAYSFTGLNITEDTEKLLAKVIFIGLNLLLLLVNIFDTEFIVTRKLPENMSYSEYVHQGVGALIWSILLAIAVILWVFRGSQNFNTNNSIKNLSYVWIGLNLWLVVSAAIRNHMYISEYDLFTYKRIGVYVFLFCATIGLALTFVKIRYKLSNYFLVRTNTLVWYVLLVCSVSINWDKAIASHHLSQAIANNREADINYVCSLSYQAYPSVVSYLVNQSKKNATNTVQIDNGQNYYLISNLIDNLAIRDINYNWKSYNYARCKTYRELDELIHPIAEQLPNQSATHYLNIFASFRNPFNF
jgi:hypothetical protein